MSLSAKLVSDFVALTNEDTSKEENSTTYGTVVSSSGQLWVQIDGANTGILTPIESVASVKEGDRVKVSIKNHTATIIGNLSSPSAGIIDLNNTNENITKIDNILSHKITTDEITAVKGYFDELISETGKFEELSAVTAELNSLKAQYADIDKINASDVEALNGKFENIKAELGKFTSIDTGVIEALKGKITSLSGYFSNFTYVSAEKLSAVVGTINSLDTKYANIDFSNINKAAIEQFYATSGIIKDLQIGDETISGTLVGVTIMGDLIKGGTVVADKLVMKGSDGLFYKLNTDGVTVSKEQTDKNSLNGKILTAKSVTAEKVQVNDLVAFDATIAGFNITDKAIYSGVKESALNTTRGIYLDKDGQISFGDANHYLRYYKKDDGTYALEIQAEDIKMGTDGTSSLLESLDAINKKVNEIQVDTLTYILIDSSNGTSFKNGSVNTDLTITLIYGKEKVESLFVLRRYFGETACLKWYYKGLTDKEFIAIDSSDDRIGNNGFIFNVSANDVNIKCIFKCCLIVNEEVKTEEQITLVDISDGRDGEDPITISIATSNGTVFKNSTGSTTLTAVVFKKNKELYISDDGVCEGYGKITWYKGTSEIPLAVSKSITITADDVNTREHYICKLEDENKQSINLELLYTGVVSSTKIKSIV